MEDLLIVAGVLVGLYVLKKHLDGTPAAIPTAAGISTALTTSGGYQVIGGGNLMSSGYGASSPYASGSVPAPLPVSAPPPPYYGGTAGGVGSGGNPLGGTLRTGVSGGTATTNPQAIDPATLAAVRATLPAGHR